MTNKTLQDRVETQDKEIIKLKQSVTVLQQMINKLQVQIKRNATTNRATSNNLQAVSRQVDRLRKEQ